MTMDVASTSLSDVLGKLSTHLDFLAGQIFDVEEALGEVVGCQTENSSLPITKFQSLDFARQSLEDCALMLSLLSEDQATEVLFENNGWKVIEKLKLDVTRGLLCTAIEPKSSHLSGEIDLF